MLTRVGRNGVRGTEIILDGQATGDGRPASVDGNGDDASLAVRYINQYKLRVRWNDEEDYWAVNYSFAINGGTRYGAVINNDDFVPAVFEAVRRIENDLFEAGAAGNGVPALQEQQMDEAPVFRFGELTPEQCDEFQRQWESHGFGAGKVVSIPLGEWAILQTLGERLEALLDERPGACYIIGGYGNDKWVRLQRSPRTALAGHGRTLTEALSSLLDCAQAEATAIGLAKAGEF